MKNQKGLYENAGGRPRDYRHYAVCRICGKVVVSSEQRDSEAFNHAVEHYKAGEASIIGRISHMWNHSKVYRYTVKDGITLIDSETMQLTISGVQSGV